MYNVSLSHPRQKWQKVVMTCTCWLYDNTLLTFQGCDLCKAGLLNQIWECSISSQYCPFFLAFLLHLHPREFAVCTFQLGVLFLEHWLSWQRAKLDWLRHAFKTGLTWRMLIQCLATGHLHQTWECSIPPLPNLVIKFSFLNFLVEYDQYHGFWGAFVRVMLCTQFILLLKDGCIPVWEYAHLAVLHYLCSLIALDMITNYDLLRYLYAENQFFVKDSWLLLWHYCT